MQRDRRDADLERELKAHLELEAEDQRDAGLSADEARHAARRELGNVARLRETVYEMGTFAFAGRWMQDVRYAARSFARNPGFATVAILSLALGIGAATAIFTIADQALFRVLPVKDPARLELLSWKGDFIGGATKGWKQSFSYPLFRELEADRPEALSNIAARFQTNAALEDESRVSRANIEIVSGGYFETLGVGASMGRTLTPEEDESRDGEPWAVLAYHAWRGRFAADPNVIGKTIRINSYPFTVIGVAQPGFKGMEGLRPADVFVPLQMQAAVTPTWDHRDRRDSIWLNIIARLAPGADPDQAVAALMSPYTRGLRLDLEAHPRAEGKRERYLRNTLELSAGAQGLSNARELIAQPLHILLGMVGLLLLITCVNVANLLVVRSAKRQKEIAVRSSLGASRGAMVRLALIECLMLSGLGAALGLAAARGAAESLARMIPGDALGLVFDTAPDWRVAAFAALVAVLTALTFGLAPAVQASRTSSAAALNSEAASVSLNRRQTHMRRVLVTTQVALSLVLLAVAGLFAKSLSRVFEAPTGLDVETLLVFFVNPSEQGYDGERTRRLALDLERHLRMQPGVAAVGVSSDPLLAGANGENTIKVEGYQNGEGENMQAGANDVLPGFFSAVGVNLLAGRDFSERDALGVPQAVVVNETFANRFLGSAANAVGRRVGTFGDEPPLPFEIVGVVADHKSRDLRETPKPRTYFPLLQAGKPGLLTVYLRASQEPEPLAAAAHAAVGELDPSLAIFGVKTLEHQMEETHYIERLFARLSAVFAALATIIAAVGLYGVAAFSVARRTREIGVRVALGADRAGIFGMVLRESFTLAAVGIGVGIPLAWGLGRLVETQLYGVAPFELGAAGAAIGVLLAACLLAGFFPARRATRISPVSALRCD